MSQDQEHLHLLSVFHYVVGGLMALFSLIPVVHLAIGLGIVSGALADKGGPEPFGVLMGWFLVVFAAGWIVVGLATAACVLLAARYLKERTHYTFCTVIAGVCCVFMPFGTVLGVFSLIVLLRPSVKELFGVTRVAEDH
jgi:hypothetical protein